ncbi:uncharacterized protein LOC128885458 [Hylaeus anthracinus]|uniref:uncharacterized protein LOC128885458 n=1 Tax=Hylaeus anthracinus TaxID=313031 RepID=UPI0023B8DCBC|nr:uncharacterized protein LOC128885458 [Hylaeus anthracinus]XP_053995493.1 uncharacterized protein LOC128885458 [Hylaeus anthracinus]
MNDEQLIELIRQYPALYDLSDSKYMDTTYKINVWNKIGAWMKEDVSVCKARWNNIRDNYRRSLKKIMTKSGKSGKKVKVYKYSQQLSFLNQQFDQRETKDSIESQEKDQTLTEEERDIPEECKKEESQEENEYVVHNDEAELNVALHMNNDSHNLSCTSDTFEISRRPIKRKAKTRNIATPQQTATSKLVDYFIKQKQNSILQHPVDAFLAGIAPTLKALPPYYLHLAKSEIFSAVQKYEMKMLTKQHFYQHSSQHSSAHTSNSSSQNTPLPSPNEPVVHHENTTATFENPNTSMY